MATGPRAAWWIQLGAGCVGLEAIRTVADRDVIDACVGDVVTARAGELAAARADEVVDADAEIEVVDAVHVQPVHAAGN